MTAASKLLARLPHRRLAWLGLSLAALLLAGGHVAFWYLPRERAAAPDPRGLPGRLLAAGAWDVCLWVPYPHQNMAVLQEAVGDWPAWVAAASRVAEVPPPALLSFGPFALPPSRELAACSDLDGGRLAVAARVYPALGAVARLAGRMADNPWLAGGTVEDGERTLEVVWEDGTWTVTGGDRRPLPPDGAGGRAAALGRRALAALRLEEGISRFPAGTYVLRRSQGDLELVLAGVRAPYLDPRLGELPAADRPLLLAATESAGGDDRRAPAALALFAGSSVSRFNLPGLALFEAAAAGARRRSGWSLPAGGLMKLARGGLPQATTAGWRIVALDRASLGRAERLAPRLAAVADPRETAERGRLGIGLWAEPRGALRLVRRVRGGLERVPLVARSEVQRWRDWETVLAPLAACEELALVSTDWPGSFRLRLAGCR